MRLKQYFVYIMTNRSGTLYIGFTSDLPQRVAQHRSGEPAGFTSRYRIDRLVYYEVTDDVRVALAREKQLKGWSRKKKFALIAAMNPQWLDLADDFRDADSNAQGRYQLSS
jgi:putative endonuclease